MLLAWCSAKFYLACAFGQRKGQPWRDREHAHNTSPSSDAQAHDPTRNPNARQFLTGIFNVDREYEAAYVWGYKPEARDDQQVSLVLAQCG